MFNACSSTAYRTIILPGWGSPWKKPSLKIWLNIDTARFLSIILRSNTALSSVFLECFRIFTLDPEIQFVFQRVFKFLHHFGKVIKLSVLVWLSIKHARSSNTFKSRNIFLSIPVFVPLLPLFCLNSAGQDAPGP